MSSDDEDLSFYDEYDNQEVFEKIEYLSELLYKDDDNKKYAFISDMEEQFKYQGKEDMLGLLNELERTHPEKIINEKIINEKIINEKIDVSIKVFGINEILKKILLNDNIKINDFNQFAKSNKYYYEFCKTIFKEKIKLWEESEMEESDERSTLIDFSFKKHPSHCKHLSELVKICKNGKFGDIILTGGYEDPVKIIIGKNQKLIHDPYHRYKSKLFHISYNITRFLRDAMSTFKSIEYTSIDLRYDDKWIKDNLNTENFSIPDDWLITLLSVDSTLPFHFAYNMEIVIDFPNNKNQLFWIQNHLNAEKILICDLNSEKINNWYLSSFKSQIKIVVRPDRYCPQPLIPEPWIIEKKISHVNCVYKGPLEEKDIVIKLISDFYKDLGINFKIDVELINDE